MSKLIGVAAGTVFLMSSALQVSAGGDAVACYRPVHSPAQYRTIQEAVLVSPGRRYVKTIPAEYGYRTRRVMVRPAQVSWSVVPARYRTIREQVLIEPARKIARTIPAVTRIAHRTVMTHPGGYAWQWKIIHGKKTLCKVRTPPAYSTVAEQVVVRPRQVVYDVVPARYGYRERTVLVSPEKRVRHMTPAQYDTVRETVVIRQARRHVVEVPPVYQTVTRQVKVREAYSGWKRVAISGRCR